MSNSIAKDLELLFGEYVEGFDAACTLSMEVKKYRASDVAMQRSADVYYRPQDYQMATQSGLDISGGSPTDVIPAFRAGLFPYPGKRPLRSRCEGTARP
jgi:hypothetical protein